MLYILIAKICKLSYKSYYESISSPFLPSSQEALRDERRQRLAKRLSYYCELNLLSYQT